MDELSPLFQEIEFHERYRGYDPDEVDAFVDRVARAAAVMRGRITELHERVEAAESRGGVVGTHSDTEETLTRTLVLAQRTADAAIAEAREEADRMTADAATSAQAIVSAAEAEAQLTLREAQAEASGTIKEAQDRAGLVLAEAETDRRAIVAEAESQATQAAMVERERLAAEVSELHDYRAFLADDIEILERHLAEERLQLASSVSALKDLLESPEAFRVSRPPATSGLELDGEMIEAIAAADPVAENEPADLAPETAPADEIEDVSEIEAVSEIEEVSEIEAVSEIEDAAEVAEAPDVDPEPVIEDPVIEDPVVEETIDLVAAEAADEADAAAPVPADEPMFAPIDLDDPDVDPDPGAAPDDGPPETFDPDPSPNEPAFAGMVESSLSAAPQVEVAPPRLVTAADLDSPRPNGGRAGFATSTFGQTHDDAGPATEAVPALQDGSLFAEPETADDPFLAQLREAMDGEPAPPADDDALSAFFDQEEDDGRSWFGRRR